MNLLLTPVIDFWNEASTMLNQFLMELSLEEGKQLYNVCGYLQFPMYIAVLLWGSFRYPTTKKQKIMLWVVFAISLYWGNSLCPLLNGITDGIVPSPNMGVSFLFFCLIAAALAYAVRLPVALTLDALIPAFILGRGAAIIGCLFLGCCNGYVCSFGVYSVREAAVVFPAVLLDSGFSFVITAFLISQTRKSGYAGAGQVAAMGLLLFGILRVFIDLLRDNQKIIFLLTFEGFCGIAYIIAGVLFLRKLRTTEISKTL